MAQHQLLRPVTLAFMVLVAIVSFLAGQSFHSEQVAAAQPIPTGTKKDGNPIGLDLVGKAFLTPYATSKNAVCLTTAGGKSCSFEIHFVGETALGGPPAGHPTPTCAPNSGGYCMTFKSSAMTLTTTTEDNMTHGPESVNITGGTIVANP
jgi:hypothetical protein